MEKKKRFEAHNMDEVVTVSESLLPTRRERTSRVPLEGFPEGRFISIGVKSSVCVCVL